MKEPLQVLRSYPPHGRSLHALLRSRVHTLGDAPFLLMEQGDWSWRQLERAVDGAAAWLHARGVVHGDRVVVVARNHPGHVILLFALARLGAIMVPVNPDFKQAELAYILGHCQPVGIFCGEEQRGLAKAARGPAGPWIVELDGAQSEFDSVVRTAPSADIDGGGADDTCILIYTSGTTGFPKGVMHSQRTLTLVGEMSVARVHLQSWDVMYVVLPLFHINALFYSLLGAMTAGARVLIRRRFSASTFWEDIDTYRVTQVNVLESVALILASRPRSEFRAGHALRVAYGVRPNAASVFMGEFGVPLLVSGYGMSEIPGFLCNPYHGPHKAGSMGVPARHPDPALPAPQARVVDDGGRPVATGQTGELHVRTPVIMQGYFNDPEQTRSAFVDGWFATGDLVRQDEDGYFYFVARKKDIIRRRGENISAAELDRVLSEHPDVAQAAVAGIPSDMGEEDILAVVVPRAGSGFDPHALADWCRTRLAVQKVPRYIARADVLPMNATHKILRKELRENSRYLSTAVDVSTQG